MTKKVIAIALIIITLISTLAYTVSAASYSTGSYTVTANNGVYVRKGAGTNYSKVGAAAKGTKFTVSKISGSWGYASTVKCTNGYKSGWISLNNCKYNSTSRSSYNDVFASVKGSGYSLSQARASQATTFNKGTFVYVWAYLHDANNNLYKTYASGTCNMTLSIYRPDGSCAHTYTYKNSDNNWIGCKLDRAGTWKIQSKISGALSGTNTRTITVKETAPTYYTLTYNANGGYGAPSSQRVAANTGFYLSSSKPTRSGYTFLGWNTSKSATSASYTPGKGVKINSNITLYAVWKKNAAVNPTGIGINYSSCSINKGETKQLTATVYPSNATNKSVTWSSSDYRILSVSSSGKLTGNAPGTATVTAKTGNGKIATCTVTVRGIEIGGVPLFQYPTVGDVIYLTTKAVPFDTTKFTWSSSNSKVVSVNSSGKMTAKSAGTATITAKTADGRTGSVKITVSNGEKWRTGNFDDGYVAKGYTTVTLNKNVGDGKIRIYTYDKLGKKTSGEVHITLRTWDGKWICEFDAKSGDTLDLGDDHSEYRVYIAKKKYPNDFWGSNSDFDNKGKCYSWAIECTSKTYIE